MIQMVVSRYFGSMDAGDVPSTLACFAEGATLEAEGMMTLSGKDEIAGFLALLVENTAGMRHEVTSLVVDPLAGKAAAELHYTNTRKTAPPIDMLNCNVFDFGPDGRFCRVKFWLGDPSQISARSLATSSRAGTALPVNAMSSEEICSFLDQPQEGRLATVRADADVHLTPVWYLFDGSTLSFCIGESRLHLRNLRRCARATLLVDSDQRPGHGWDKTAKAVMLSGPVDLVYDPDEVERCRRQIVLKYVGEHGYKPVQDRYVLARLHPVRTLSWDFAKG